MKFTASQLEFLMTKLTISLDEFVKEAEAYKPSKKTPVRKEISVEIRCQSLKKDGSRCTYKSKQDGMCMRHQLPKISSLGSATLLLAESDTCSENSC